MVYRPVLISMSILESIYDYFQNMYAHVLINYNYNRIPKCTAHGLWNLVWKREGATRRIPNTIGR